MRGDLRRLVTLGALAVMVAGAGVGLRALADPDPTSDPVLSRAANDRSGRAALAPDGTALRLGQRGASTCTDPRSSTQWRVAWVVAETVDGGSPGRAVLSASGFASRALPGAAQVTDGWQDRSGDNWVVRWTPTLHEALTAAAAETFDRTGNLAALLATPIRVDQEPRWVSPDGACTVYAIPFGIGRPVASPADAPPRVAVLGDSLTAQLSAPDGDALTGPGALHRRMGAYRFGMDAQAGRKFAISPEGWTGTVLANSVMTDEIRGMASADALVIALGVNDVGWVAAAPVGQYDLRMSWVLMQLAPFLDELDAPGRCVVLVTVADRAQTYPGTTTETFSRASTQFNQYLAQRVATSTGALRLSDWAKASADHHRDGPQPWFGEDTIHLNTVGRAAYADHLAAAAELC